MLNKWHANIEFLMYHSQTATMAGDRVLMSTIGVAVAQEVVQRSEGWWSDPDPCSLCGKVSLGKILKPKQLPIPCHRCVNACVNAYSSR